MRPGHGTRLVGRVRLFVTPWCRAYMTDTEWDALRSLDIDASVHMFAASARGPFTVRLGREGFDRIDVTRRTLPDALADVIAAVEAAA